MLTDFDFQLAEHLKQALIERNVPLYKTIVFGSRARGERSLIQTWTCLCSLNMSRPLCVKLSVVVPGKWALKQASSFKQW